MICGTLNPTTGGIQTHGRIAALLELGSGFNPEFSGRENVYMNGAVLGISREEIDQRFDDIAAFADIGDFIEQPVKTYSSGMMVRLAFAVAINVQPEILIIDEALSVGDELFQRKCFSRIEKIRADGATILFVSHSGSQIVDLCVRAVLFDCGERLAEGIPKQIVGRYQKLIYAPAERRDLVRDQIRRDGMHAETLSYHPASDPQLDSVQKLRLQKSPEDFDPNLKPTSTIEYESHGAYIDAPAILNLAGDRVNNLLRGNTYRYCYTVRFSKSAKNIRFGMLIKTTTGIELGGSMSAIRVEKAIPVAHTGSTFRVEFRFNANLNAGVYFLNAGVVGQTENGSDGYLHRLVDVAMFRILPESDSNLTALVDFGCVPEFELIET